MANTKVTEAYFMPNVTANAIENSKKAQSDGLSFGQIMNDTTEKNKEDTDSGEVKSTSAVSYKKPTNDRTKQAMDKAEGKPVESQDKVANKISEGGNEVKDKIKDTFGASDEEIEEVMTAMGITAVDLLNPEILKEVMVTLSGVEDSMELLTNEDLYSSMQDILESAKDITRDIAMQSGIDVENVIALTENKELFEKVSIETIGNLEKTDDLSTLETQAVAATTDQKTDNVIVNNRDDNTLVSKEVNTSDTGSHIQAGNASDKLESFRNITKTDSSENRENEQGMNSMTQTQTTVTINSQGELVETVQRFTEGFNDAREIISQITEHVKLDFSSDSTTMEMQLHPATLGTVNMQVSSQNGVVTAHILVQNESVKAAIESQFIALQETFEEQGHHVEAVEVSVANYDLNRGMHSNTGEQERENALRSGKVARRRLKLDEISDEDMEKLTEEDKVTADMMRRQGNSVDFMA